MQFTQLFSRRIKRCMKNLDCWVGKLVEMSTKRQMAVWLYVITPTDAFERIFFIQKQISRKETHIHTYKFHSTSIVASYWVTQAKLSTNMCLRRSNVRDVGVWWWMHVKCLRTLIPTGSVAADRRGNQLLLTNCRVIHQHKHISRTDLAFEKFLHYANA